MAFSKDDNALSSAHLVDVRIDVGIDCDTFIHSPHPRNFPMSDKATPRQPRPQQYCGDLAAAKQSNSQDLSAWQREIHERIKEYPADIEDFLLDMLPSNAPPTCCPYASETLQSVSLKKKEVDMYDPLVGCPAYSTVY